MNTNEPNTTKRNNKSRSLLLLSANTRLICALTIIAGLWLALSQLL